MIIKLLVDGGNMKPGPTVGQQLGPVGINIGEVISKVNAETAQFKGTKVPVALDIDTATKEFTISISSPPTAELLKKELGLEKCSGDHKKEKVANASIEQVISIAKTKHNDMLSKDLKASVKSVLGSCTSLGILVENKEAKEIIKDIDTYDTEINEQRTETSPEKKAALKKYFDRVVKQQEAAKKEEEEAAKVAEEEKAKAAEAEAAAEGAPEAAEEKPAEEGKPEEEGAEEGAKEAEKPAEEGKK